MNVENNYVYSVNLNEQNTASYIIDMVGSNKNVLEAGAGPGSITKLLVNTLGCQVTAIEIDESSIQNLKQYCSSVHKLDLNNENWITEFSSNRHFDIVVAADVLEHLHNPLSALLSFKKLLNPDGSIIVSLPHIGHSSIYACLMDNDFEYRDWGLLDRTHIRFFGIKNMQRLFDDAGLKIVDVKFVLRKPEYTEYAKRWSQMPNEFRKVIKKNKYSDVYQVVFRTVPVEALGERIDLLMEPVSKTPISVVREINKLLLLYTPSFVHKKLRNLYIKFFS